MISELASTRRRMLFGACGCVTLIGLPFACFAVYLAACSAGALIEGAALLRWERVPATIVRFSFENRYNGVQTGELAVEYTYEYHGRRYTAIRAGRPKDATSEMSAPESDLYHELEAHQRSGTNPYCYVNPIRPAESRLASGVQWRRLIGSVCFTLIYCGIGFGIVSGGVIGLFKIRKEARLAAAHPKEPWLWKSSWAEGRIGYSAKVSVIVLALIAFFFFAGALMVLWGSISEADLVAHHSWFMAGRIVAGVIDAGIVAWLLVSLRRWHKFGRSVFEMACVPGVAGEELAGVIRIPTRIQPREFRLELICLQIVDGGRPPPLWRDEQTVRSMPDRDGRNVVPVLFHIPDTARETNSMTTIGAYIQWQLVVRAAMPGIDYYAKFEVPVFKDPHGGR